MDEEKLLAVLGDAKFKFWCCSQYEEHKKDNELQPMVEWDGDRAICLICGETNA